MTRWSTKDLTGQLLKAQEEDDSDQWEVVELPAILPSGKPVWPEYWTKEELTKTKSSIPVSNWNAQYMQQPTAEELLSNVTGGETGTQRSTTNKIQNSILRYNIFEERIF